MSRRTHDQDRPRLAGSPAVCGEIVHPEERLLLFPRVVPGERGNSVFGGSNRGGARRPDWGGDEPPGDAPAYSPTTAVAAISTRNSGLTSPACTHARAGGFSGKYEP